MCGNLRFALRFCVLAPLLILPHPILCSTFVAASGCIAGKAKDPHHKAGKQGRQKRKTSAANLRKKHYYIPCKKRFFRLSSSYLYFFHILTIMCCQNKIFPRLRPFSVEHTGGVSSCSTGKRKPAGHGRRVRSLPAQYSWISRKRDGEESHEQRGCSAHRNSRPYVYQGFSIFLPPCMYIREYEASFSRRPARS